MFVSFIVPALNEEKHIARCVASIQRLSRPSNVSGLEVVVADNHSSDRTVQVSKDCGVDAVVISHGHASQVRNAGVQAARGDLLAFVDADFELDSNWLSRCVGILGDDSQVVAVAGTLRAPSNGASWVERAWHALAYAAPDQAARRVRWLPSCNLLVHRDAYQRAGGYDESLATCEDCDFAYKLSDFGKLVLEPSTQALHLGESRSLTELFCREAWRSHGNLRLALRRPFDWENWFSLLAPPCALTALVLSLGGALMASFTGEAVWPWLCITAAIACCLISLVFKKTRTINPLTLAKQAVVFITYLAGRTTGLIFQFRRIER
jgi:glycosyltransferase involved in cell wall biosynthesis